MAKMVSIIIPTKGREQFLLAACYCVISQTYQNWEVLIISDESYDPTPMISLLKNKEKFRVFRSDSTCGVGCSRNIGLDNAKGSYIAYLDDDDLWSNDYLNTQISILESSGADAVWCNYQLSTQIWDDTKDKYVQHFLAVPYNIPTFNRNTLLVEPYIHISTVVHTKDIKDLVKFSNIPVLDDWKFLIDSSRLFKFHHCEFTLVTIQRRMDGTNRRNEPGNETVRSMHIMMESTKEQVSDPNNVILRTVLLNQCTNLNEVNYIKEVDQLKKLVESRGYDVAYGYLLSLMKMQMLDYNVCKFGSEIAKATNHEELAEDLLWLAAWYRPFSGLEFDENYVPKNFTRKNDRWIALQ